jgi:hypothetical protein
MVKKLLMSFGHLQLRPRKRASDKIARELMGSQPCRGSRARWWPVCLRRRLYAPWALSRLSVRREMCDQRR